MLRSSCRRSDRYGALAWRLLALLPFLAPVSLAAKEPASPTLQVFERQQLTDGYFSEGINIGDINGDGLIDVVHGPYWFAGPEFTERHEIYEPKPQNRDAYADNFFCWVRDFDHDGHNDVLVVGFPGTPAYVYRNPGDGDEHWSKHEVLDWVSNESPQFTDLVGDERPELVCTRDGFFGFASIDEANPLGPWKFTGVSEQIADKRFGHGLGVGDVNGDGRQDILFNQGWLEQPRNAKQARWRQHAFNFAPASADMFAYDVDGDGDQDVVTSLSAHNFGLAWYEQTGVDASGEVQFEKHLIMGDKPEQNAFGLVFSELHTVGLHDMDGDGLKDIVTGKTYWSHHRQSPMWDAGAVVYWFKLSREGGQVSWTPYQADDEAGVGRQVVIGDVNNDELPDIVVGGMKGAHVLRHFARKVSLAEWQAAQPKPYRPLANGLPPQEAAAQMTALPGFEVTLAAGEPLIHQPIAMTLDDRGRIWIAEAYTYPNRAPEGQGKDKIVILEDADQNGSFETRKVFAEGLNLVSGMEVGFGGVWVGAAPYLMFIPDRDGDDQPDGEPQILLDGFGYHDTHETLNAFIWGPDGWLYGCHGVFTHSKVGKPGTPENERTPLNAGVWRYHPVRHEFEVFAWGTSNPWGVDFNDQGQAFITACVIPHLYHVIQGARYQRQAGQDFNPYVYDDIKTIADHLHYAGDIRDHAWWGHEPTPASNTLQAGGGHAHCGAMIYLGDNFPELFRNQIFMNNIHGNRVNQDQLERHGSGYVGHHGADLVAANDRWFRGINLRYGPDGSVYFIDWYDPNACHRTNPEIWDRTNGRLYNISYGEQQPVAVNLGEQTDLQLAQLQLHANDWYVRVARRLLQQRAAERGVSADAVVALQEIADRHEDPTRVLRAMWTLHGIGAAKAADYRRWRSRADEYVRAWTIQLQLETAPADSPLAAEFTAMAAKDPSPVVRLYLASALQRLPAEQRWPIAEALAGKAEDAEDHNLPLMLWYGFEPLVVQDASRALQLAATTKIPLLQRFILRRAAGDNELLDQVAAAATEARDVAFQKLILEEMLQAFEGRVDIPAPPAWQACYASLAASDDAEVRDRADEVAILLGDKRVFPRMRQRVLDPAVDMNKRQQALAILVRGADADSVPTYQQLITTSTDGENPLRGPAIRALAGFQDPATADILIDAYPHLSVAERQDAVNTLCGRRSYAEKMLQAIADNRIPRTDLHAFNVRLLLGLDQGALHDRITEVWGTVREASADRQKAIADWKQRLAPDALQEANASNGRRVFSTSCAQCHRLFGGAGDIGPDLTGSNRANLDYVLQNILDPSAVLGKDYQLTLINTVDGRVLSGIVKGESDSALTLRTINDTIVVAKRDIEDRQLSNMSMMPEQLLDKLTFEEVRDLVRYLASSEQVAIGGPKSLVDSQTGRVEGAIEGESMMVVGKSGGQARNQDMRGFRADRWSGADHLWWTGGKPGDTLDLQFTAPEAGPYDLDIVLTRAPDYAMVQLAIDDQPLGEVLDLYDPQVVTTGVITYPQLQLDKGEHRLRLRIEGANPKAVKAYMVGLDYIRLRPTK